MCCASRVKESFINWEYRDSGTPGIKHSLVSLSIPDDCPYSEGCIRSLREVAILLEVEVTSTADEEHEHQCRPYIEGC